MKRSIYLFAVALAGSFVFSGCIDDFLTQTNNGSPNPDTFFDSKEALDAATAPLYNRVWWQFNEKFYYGMGDGRANNLTAMWSDYIYPYTNLTETSLTPTLTDAWGALYNVVSQADNTINNILNKSTGVTEAEMNESIAEARFMRGVAYWYLASLWGDVIIYEDPVALINSFNVPPHRQIDAMEFAIRDLEYAAKHLPKTASVAGRLTRYSAFGMLSRVYLSMAGLYQQTNPNSGTRNQEYLDLAQKAALKVCTESSYKLMPNYGDLFKYENNNNQESLFQLQWVVGTQETIGGSNQPQQAFFAWEAAITEDGAAWGWATYASCDMIREYAPQDTLRRHATFATFGAKYPELMKSAGGLVYEIKDRCNVKKGVIGSNKDNGVNQKQSSGLNTNMMRLAEVYLNLAEAILGNNSTTNDETALFYFNEVRKRAKMLQKDLISYEDIRYERRIELAMEGQYWYDLLRRAYYKQQEVINYMNSQDRNASYEYDASEPSQYVKKDDATPGTVSTATANKLLLPYPETDLVKNPSLKADPIAYTFTEPRISDLFD